MRQAAYAAAALVALIAAGTVAYMAVMGQGFVEALYQTVITLSSLGLADTPDTTGARLLTVALLICGVAIYLYVFSTLIELVVGGTVSGAWRERRIRRRVGALSEHYIVCGYGRMGRGVVAALRSTGAPHVVLDADADAVAAAREEGGKPSTGPLPPRSLCARPVSSAPAVSSPAPARTRRTSTSC